jgi:NDP-sugar pyrophosphorylase family protein
MAGGRGERMRAAGVHVPKPLVQVLGTPLLEWSLEALLRAGYRDLVVAVPAHTPEIGELASGRGRRLAERHGAALRLFEESLPLGNIGAAAEIGEVDGDLLVVYADNLTALRLPDLVEHHRRLDAALTTAVHLEPFRVPFGAVEVADGLIVAYREKPELPIRMSSGVYLLSPAAIAAIPRGVPTGASDLVNRLLSAGARVGAYEHGAPWIDVNDLEAVARAEALVGSHPEAFGR